MQFLMSFFCFFFKIGFLLLLLGSLAIHSFTGISVSASDQCASNEHPVQHPSLSPDSGGRPELDRSCLVPQASASKCPLVVLWGGFPSNFSSLAFNQMEQEWLQVLSHHSCENNSDNKTPFWKHVLKVSLGLFMVFFLYL